MALVSTGIGSGLDVSSIISQLITLERQPLVALDKKEATFQAKLSAYGTLKGALSSFQTTVRGLSDIARYQTLKAASADTTIYTASGSTTALAGNYAVEVVKLAQAHKINTTGQASNIATIGAGTSTTLTFDFGTISGGTLGGDGKYTGATYTLNPNKSSKTVTIDSTNNSLEGIRNAINAAKIGVTATIINDGTATPYRLVLAASDTGVANSLRIAVSGDATLSSLLAYNAAGTQNPAQTLLAQDAELKVDGITGIKKASNTVTDVVQGVTLNLLKQSSSGVTTTLTVSRDTDTLKSSVDAFVKTYNDINKTLTDLTAYNKTTKQGSILQGDSSTLSIQKQIRDKLNSTIASSGGAYTKLSEIGVSFQKDGSLTVNSTKLQTAIDANFSDIAALFSAVGKTSDSLISYTSSTANTKAGSYDVTVSTLAARGYFNGSGVLPAFPPSLTIDANNDNFTVKIDATTSASIALTQGTYTTGASLAAEIQAKINGDSALQAASAAVDVSYESASNRFVVTSRRYGLASTIEFTAVDTNTAANLGFSVTTGTVGVDAAGTINGAAAPGSGQYLIGATGNDSEGLKLQVLGGSTGSRGTVKYSQGYAYQLDKLADNFLATTGPVNSRTDGINKSIKDIDKQRDTLNQRLADVEQRLRAQFTALDLLVGKLKGTNDFLTQQLARLPGTSSR
ncbi:MAG TPA: flagellar filament capping protein FliD [Gammaproteobacteria bacterium]|nr:flagellar filament capping protein FliD [Gammaproteobacteria bacterium]